MYKAKDNQLIHLFVHAASGVSLDLIYKSLNRTVLYQLSRSINTVSAQTTVLDSLHKLTNNRTLIFGPKNYDTEFLVCLCYCLLQLTEDPEKRYPFVKLNIRYTFWPHSNLKYIITKFVSLNVELDLLKINLLHIYIP